MDKDPEDKNFLDGDFEKSSFFQGPDGDIPGASKRIHPDKDTLKKKLDIGKGMHIDPKTGKIQPNT